MLCTLSRWMVSRTEDTGKKLPRFAERHVGRCSSCREFARSAASLSSRLRSDRDAWLAKVPDFPPVPGPDAEPFSAGPRMSVAGAGRPRRFRSTLGPLPVAAGALAIVAGALVLFQVVLKEPSPSPQDREAALAAIRSLAAAPEGLQGAIGEAESSLAREREILERSVSSALEYLQARLNIRIERRDVPESF